MQRAVFSKRRSRLDFDPRWWDLLVTRHSSLGTVFEGGSNSVVESQPSKLLVAGSIPVSRSRKQWLVESDK